MANEKRLIDANDVYALFNPNGMARLHVADIDVIPTVDAAEVVHGRWSPVTYGLGITVTRWMCSNCKKYENSYGRTNYCPNCGANMDGGGLNGSAPL